MAYFIRILKLIFGASLSFRNITINVYDSTLDDLIRKIQTLPPPRNPCPVSERYKFLLVLVYRESVRELSVTPTAECLAMLLRNLAVMIMVKRYLGLKLFSKIFHHNSYFVTLKIEFVVVCFHFKK